MDCSVCDSVIKDDQLLCRCGFKLKPHYKKKKVQHCSIWPCQKEGRFAGLLANGQQGIYCTEHYEKWRPKTDIEKELEKRMQEYKSSDKSTIKKNDL
jgi:hypothetical protein